VLLELEDGYSSTDQSFGLDERSSLLVGVEERQETENYSQTVVQQQPGHAVERVLEHLLWDHSQKQGGLDAANLER
jgi:hypothetical protein